MSILLRVFRKLMSLMLIPYDKALHFIYGFLIFITIGAFIHIVNAYLTLPLFIMDFAPLFSVVIFAIGKEYYDYKSYGKFDLSDMVMTIIPAMIMVAYLAMI